MLGEEQGEVEGEEERRKRKQRERKERSLRQRKRRLLLASFSCPSVSHKSFALTEPDQMFFS